MTTAKNDVFIGLYLENFYLVWGNWLLVDGEGIKIWWWVEDFQGQARESKFFAGEVGGDYTHA